ncbi:MAG: hypothetical protein WBO46_18340 [Caldilineaceae bacterium]
MATLPINIGVGMVSIYNAGASTLEMFAPGEENQFIRFGIIEQTSNQFGVAARGASVMFDIRDAKPIFYIDHEYYILPEGKIGGIEDIPV